MAAGSVSGAALTGRSIPKLVHYRRPAVFGLALSAAALAALAATIEMRSFALADGLLFLFGLGLGPIFPTVTVSVQNAVARRDLGAATGLLAFLRSLGSAFGVAILGAIVLGAGGEGVTAAGLDIDPSEFRLAFIAALIATLIGLGCLAAMPERPLRDTIEPHGSGD